MANLRNINNPVVQQIVESASAINCEILKVNLRRNWFHVRSGDEVRLGFFYKGISQDNLRVRVQRTAQWGQRIDDLPNSLYARLLA